MAYKPSTAKRENIVFLPFARDDGGRAAAGFKGSAGDCVARSVAIASGRPYAEVYGAKEADMSAVLVIRHAAIPMVLNDEMWRRLNVAKELASAPEGSRVVLKDPASGELPTRNPFLNARGDRAGVRAGAEPRVRDGTQGGGARRGGRTGARAREPAAGDVRDAVGDLRGRAGAGGGVQLPARGLRA